MGKGSQRPGFTGWRQKLTACLSPSSQACSADVPGAAGACPCLLSQLSFSCLLALYYKTLCLLLLQSPFKVTAIGRPFLVLRHPRTGFVLSPGYDVCGGELFFPHLIFASVTSSLILAFFFTPERTGSCYVLVLLLSSQCLGQNLMNWPTRDICWTKTNMGIHTYFSTGVGKSTLFSALADSQPHNNPSWHIALSLGGNKVLILPELDSVESRTLSWGSRRGFISRHLCTLGNDSPENVD